MSRSLGKGHGCSSLPLIHRNLTKSKKYYLKPHHTCPLQQDLDNVMHSMVSSPAQPKKINLKLKRDIDRTLKQHQQLTTKLTLNKQGEELRKINEEVKKWMMRMPSNPRVLGEDYKEFRRLA